MYRSLKPVIDVHGGGVLTEPAWQGLQSPLGSWRLVVIRVVIFSLLIKIKNLLGKSIVKIPFMSIDGYKLFCQSSGNQNGAEDGF